MSAKEGVFLTQKESDCADAQAVRQSWSLMDDARALKPQNIFAEVARVRSEIKQLQAKQEAVLRQVESCSRIDLQFLSKQVQGLKQANLEWLSGQAAVEQRAVGALATLVSECSNRLEKLRDAVEGAE